MLRPYASGQTPPRGGGGGGGGPTLAILLLSVLHTLLPGLRLSVDGVGLLWRREQDRRAHEDKAKERHMFTAQSV